MSTRSLVLAVCEPVKTNVTQERESNESNSRNEERGQCRP